MAEAKITVSLDDESKELIRELVNAVNRIAKAQGVTIYDASFATPPSAADRARVRRLLED